MHACYLSEGSQAQNTRLHAYTHVYFLSLGNLRPIIIDGCNVIHLKNSVIDEENTKQIKTVSVVLYLIKFHGNSDYFTYCTLGLIFILKITS